MHFISFHSANPGKQFAVRLASVLSIFWGILVIVSGNCESDKSLERQQKLQDTINSTQSLGEINRQLAEKIQKLQFLNNSIASNTGKIVTETKILTEKVAPVIISTKGISLKMDKVLDEVKKE